ncbi:ComF family protein [Psychrobacter faecalis]|uniref:ComF family protein n=1 Tax=Psychrobacter faecalis TaxID=180588 RepID=UPI003FCFED44
MTQNLIGRWKGGWALDLHTVSSKINLDGSYDNVRSKIGEALYLLKYRNDNSQIDFLVNELVEFLKTRMVLKYIDVIIPVPASFQRNSQPVYVICDKVGKQLNINTDFNFVNKIKETQQLKSIKDIEERKIAISNAFEITDPNKYRNKKILIIDDLYRSGTTLIELTNLLYDHAHVQNVYVVTLTKTRSNR